MLKIITKAEYEYLTETNLDLKAIVESLQTLVLRKNEQIETRDAEIDAYKVLCNTLKRINELNDGIIKTLKDQKAIVEMQLERYEKKDLN